MIEPKEHTVTNKVTEIFRALQIERHLSKDETLTYYLNTASDNITGSTAASLINFNQEQNI